MPFNIGPTELIIILVIALVVLGPGKLPEVGAALGKSIREFRKAASDVRDAATVEPAATPPAATAAQPVAPVQAAAVPPAVTAAAVPPAADPAPSSSPAEVPAGGPGPEAPAS